ncbi:MAG: hypothetical protein V4672_20200 [Verrucomicrobiota bacterium]
MPPHDPSDDFSQLPTADGNSPHGHPQQPPVRRQQTRIGPRSTAAPAEAPPAEEPPAPLSDEWQELLQSSGPAPSTFGWPESAFPSHSQELPPQEPAPPPTPRRTVVGRRAPVPEASPPPAAEEQPPEVAPAPAAPRRTVIGKRPATPTADAAPPAAPEPPPQPPEKPAPLAEEKRPAATPKSKHKKADPEPAPTPESKADKAPQESSGEKTTDAAEGKETTPSSENAPTTTVPVQPGLIRQYWERWGGKALSLSVAVHALLLLGGAWIVVTQVTEKQVDFLPGGGTKQGAEASQALEHKIQQKKNPWLKKAMPLRKIAAANSISDIVLPDEAPDLLELPQSKDLFASNKLTAGMGLAGAGGGFGKSVGLGGQSGMTFQPFSMFGMQIKAKRLALVLDVSTSMAPHLPRVIEEVDKVARGSIVILYFGCGLEPPPPQGLEGDEVYSTSSVEFEKFWRLGGATLEETRKFRIDPKKEMQSEAIYRVLSKRPQTYFIHNTGLGYTWLALLHDKLRTADGIYWFSDFQDRVDFKQVTIVRENLERRKQRLYMHAYMRGTAYDLVKTQLVDPTKGDVKLEE